MLALCASVWIRHADARTTAGCMPLPLTEKRDDLTCCTMGRVQKARVPGLCHRRLVVSCRKVVRQVYYLLQLLLGVGSAGTPSPTPGKAHISIEQPVHGTYA